MKATWTTRHTCIHLSLRQYPIIANIKLACPETIYGPLLCLVLEYLCTTNTEFRYSCRSGSVAPGRKKFRLTTWELQCLHCKNLQFSAHKICASFGLMNLIFTKILRKKLVLLNSSVNSLLISVLYLPRTFSKSRLPTSEIEVC